MVIVVSGGVHALSHAHADGINDCAMCRLAHEPCAAAPVPFGVSEVTDSGAFAASFEPIQPSDEGPLRPNVPRAPPR
jgi:hypothetical protein